MDKSEDRHANSQLVGCAVYECHLTEVGVS